MSSSGPGKSGLLPSLGRGRGRIRNTTPNPYQPPAPLVSVSSSNQNSITAPLTASVPGGYTYSSSEDEDEMFSSSVSSTSTFKQKARESGSGSSTVPPAKINPRSTLPPIPDVTYERSCSAAKSINTAWNNGPRNIDIVASGISQTLEKEFREAKNPFATALDLMVYSTDFFSYKQGSKFLAFEVMVEFKKWLKNQEKLYENFSSSYLKPTLQICAFEIVLRQRSSDLVKLVFELFQLKTMSKDFIISIKQFCSSGQYKEACVAAESLELFDQFDIHEFIIPLILQDRESLAMTYLMGSKSNQEAVMGFLDSIIGNRNNKHPQNYFHDYARSRKIENVKFEKLDLKPLSKLVGRLASKFNIDIMNCTNTGREKRLGMIRHLMYRKYQINEAISDDAFHELLDSTAASDSELVEEIMVRLRREGDNAAAAKFGLRHKYSPDKCAYEIQVEMNRIDPNVIPVEPPKQQPWDEDWDITEDEIRQMKNERYVQNKSQVLNPEIGTFKETMQMQPNEILTESQMEVNVAESVPQFYECPISKIQLINTVNGLDAFLKHVKALTSVTRKSSALDCLIVGVDCEWKPLVPQGNGVALFQIALADQIYLLDTFTLGKAFQIEKSFEKLFKEFFSNEEIIKIGYSFDGDFRMLMRTSPVFREIKEKIKSLLDLSLLAKELTKDHPNFFPYYSIKSGLSGLSELVFLCTGKQVNKEEQFSDWEKRPLRQAQIEYASADAYCLLDIFSTIKSRAEEFGLNLEDICKRLMTGMNNKEEKKKKLTSDQVLRTARDGSITAVTHIESPFRFKTRNAKDIKLVCDNMCQGLGKQLRACGIDTVILGSHESHSTAAQHALQDNRYVVTSGKIYDVLAGFVPTGCCLGLSSDNVVNQLREVLSYFNITISNDDIYTICQKCNCNTFLQVSGASLAKIGHSLGRFPRQLHREGSIEEDQMFQNGVIEIEGEAGSQRHWKLLPETDLVVNNDSRSLSTKSGASIMLSSIPAEVFDYVSTFYICDSCGKCYWIGGQFRRGF